jgi:hypothetical protein
MYVFLFVVLIFSATEVKCSLKVSALGQERCKIVIIDVGGVVICGIINSLIDNSARYCSEMII